MLLLRERNELVIFEWSAWIYLLKEIVGVMTKVAVVHTGIADFNELKFEASEIGSFQNFWKQEENTIPNNIATTTAIGQRYRNTI